MFLLLALAAISATHDFQFLIFGPVYLPGDDNSDLAKITQCHSLLQSREVLAISHWFSKLGHTPPITKYPHESE